MIVLLLWIHAALAVNLENILKEKLADFTLHGHVVDFQYRKADPGANKLWVMEGNGTWPITSKYAYVFGARPEGRAAHVLPPYKYRPENFPTKCEHVIFFHVDHGMKRAKCQDVAELAKKERVMWIDFVPTKMKLNYYIAPQTQAGSTVEVLLDGQTNEGAGVTVMVVDTGLDPYHDMFNDPLNSFPQSLLGQGLGSSSHAKIRGIISSMGLAPNRVTNAHGTAAAGCAVGAESLDVSGTAPGAKLLFMDISPDGESLSEGLYDVSQGEFMIEDILEEGLLYGATVTTHSYGFCFTSGDYHAYARIMDEFNWNNPRTIHVASAGNMDSDCTPSGQLTSPATGKNVISVGASFSKPSEYPDPVTTLFTPDSVASFSCVGPLTDGRRAPIFNAPGYNERVALARSYDTPNPGHSDMGRASGTSFSAPSVAGMAAVFQSWYTGQYDTLPLSSTFRAAMLLTTIEPVRRVSVSSGQAIGNVGQFGYGTPQMGDLSLWKYNEIELSNTRWAVFLTGATEVAISWLDRPGTVGASKALVDDYQLFVVSAAGRRLNGHDTVNTQEFIRGMDAAKKRVVVTSDITSSGYVSVVFAASATVESAGTCLPGEYVSCTNGYRICDLATGEFSSLCQVHACPEGLGGASCELTMTSSTCVLIGADNAETYEEMVSHDCKVTACTRSFYVIDSDGEGCHCLYNDYVYSEDGLVATTLCPALAAVVNNPTRASSGSTFTPHPVTTICIVLAYIYLLL